MHDKQGNKKRLCVNILWRSSISSQSLPVFLLKVGASYFNGRGGGTASVELQMMSEHCDIGSDRSTFPWADLLLKAHPHLFSPVKRT